MLKKYKKYKPIFLIKPEIIKWLIVSHGFNTVTELAELSKKSRISESTLKSFLDGTSHPTWPDVEKLAKTLGINPYLFYLNEKVDRFSYSKLLPHDHRKLYGNVSTTLLDDRISLSLAAKKARSMQDMARELMILLKDNFKPDIPEHISLNHNPVSVAKEIREKSGINKSTQKSWKNEVAAFNEFRKYIESKNILVFDISFNSKITRGFSYADAYPYVIVVKHADAPASKSFTLFHEYGHLLLREGSLCGIDFVSNTVNNNETVEAWCNNFAAEFLMPTSYIEEDLETMKDDSHLLDHLSTQYKVSREAVLIKLKKLGKISSETFETEKEKIVKKIFDYNKGGWGKGTGRNIEKERIREYGNKFISLTNRNLALDKISYRDALSYLNVKEKVYEKIKAIYA